MRQILIFLALGIFFIPAYTQDVLLDGYVFESGNRGYLNAVQIKVKDAQSQQLMTATQSDKEGHFSVSLPVGDFILSIEKDLFHPIQKTIKIDGTAPKIFEKIQMERKPGYLLDATIAEKRSNPTQQVDAITNSLIEVFNNTKDELVLILENHPYPTFKTTFERGNHYTLLIRKDGFVPKRLEAYVDIKGCILCFDGVGSIQPGISDVLTESNQMGTFLANIELERLTSTNKPATLYGTESLVEIIFMENLNSEVIEVGADGQIIGGSTVYQAPSQTSYTKTSRNASSNPSSSTLSTQPVQEKPKNTGNRTTITGIVSAPTSSTTTTERPATRVADTPTVNTTKSTVVTVPKPTKTTKNVNTTIESKIVPDYKRTSSSTSTILARGNRGETLVKTASTDPKDKTKMNAAKKVSPKANKVKNNIQGESLVQTTKPNNKAKFIEKNYTGYLIEILLSTKEISADNPIFKQHGEVKKELRSDGGYSYLLGGFSKKKAATAFLKDVIRGRYPMAKVVYYMNGKFVGYVYVPRNTNG